MAKNIPTRLIVFATLLILTVGFALADDIGTLAHTSSADLQPAWSASGLVNDYNVTITNDGTSQDPIRRVIVYQNEQYTNLVCENKTGWTLSPITDFDPGTGSLTDACQYSTNLTFAISPGSSDIFEFQSTAPLGDTCELEWSFETQDSFTSEGERRIITDTTGVDSTTPTFDKVISGNTWENPSDETHVCDPYPGEGEVCYVDQDTDIQVTITDPGVDSACEQGDTVQSGLDYCTVQVLVDGEPVADYNEIYEPNGNDLSEIEFTMNFDEDSEHDFTFTCFDRAGNELTDTEKFRVDSTAPDTTVEFDGPQKRVGDTIWIDSVTTISLDAIDPDTDAQGYTHASGVNRTRYTYERVEDSECKDGVNNDVVVQNDVQTQGHYYTYTEPFTMPEGSCHELTFYSVDNLGNEEAKKTTYYYVDKTPPALEKQVSAPKAPLFDFVDDRFETLFTQELIDNEWEADRAYPTAGANSVSAFGRNNVLQIAIDSSETASGTFQRTEGVKTSEYKNYGEVVQADLYLDPAWEDQAVRAGIWVVGDDGSNDNTTAGRDQWFGIVEFTNQENSTSGDTSTIDHTGWRIWDSSVGWTTLNTSFNYGEWVSLKIELDTDAEQYNYYIDETLVGSATGGENFIREIFINSYNYGLDNFPILDNGDYEAHWSGLTEVRDWYVGPDTTITLLCEDQEPHPSGDETITWTLERTEDGSNYDVVDEGSEETTSKVLSFANASQHRLNWLCSDAVNKTAYAGTQYYKADFEPPVINKTVVGPQSGVCPPPNQEEQPGNVGNCSITEDTQVVVNVSDFESIHASNAVTCDYSVEWNNSEIDSGSFGEEGMVFNWDEDSEHNLTLTCRDRVGNEIVDVETFNVDISPPTTVKEYGMPQINETNSTGFYRWITSDTPITLTATDEKSNIKGMYYAVDLYSNETCEAYPDQDAGYNLPTSAPDLLPGQLQVANGIDWMWTTNSSITFNIPQTSCHRIKYRAIDEFNNFEAQQVQYVNVDNDAPNATKIVGQPQVLLNDTVCIGENNETCFDYARYVTQNTEIALTCSDVQPHPVGQERVSFQVTNNGTDITQSYCEDLSNGAQASQQLKQVAYVNGSCEVYGNDYSFTFNEDSQHTLSWTCTDGLGNAAEPVDQLYFVETVAPVTSLNISEPYYVEDGVTWADSATTFSLNAYDPQPHPSGVADTYYRYGMVDDAYCEGTTEEPVCLAEESLDSFTVDEATDSQGVYDLSGEGLNDLQVYFETSSQGVEVTAELPADFVNETQDNVAFTFDADADGEADFQMSYHANQADHFAGTHWGYQEVIGGSWSAWQAVPGDITVTQISVDTYEVSVPQTYFTCGDMRFGVAGSYQSTQVNPGHNLGFNFPADFSWGNNFVGSEDYYSTGFDTIEWTNSSDEFNFSDESCHAIEYYSIDELGNNESTQVEFIYKDETPPAIDIDFVGPYHQHVVDVTNESSFLAQYIHPDLTNISVFVEDPAPHPSGVAESEYRFTQVDDEYCEDYALGDGVVASDYVEQPYTCSEAEGEGSWMSFEQAVNFSIGQESCHLIEVRATDNVNKSSEDRVCTFVDGTAPNTSKQVGQPVDQMSSENIELGNAFYENLTQEFCDENDMNCLQVTTLSPVSLTCEDQDPHPSGVSEVEFTVDFDGNDVTQAYCEGISDEIVDFNGQSYPYYNSTSGNCVAEEGFQIQFRNESWHKLEYTCTDNVGNVGEPDIEYFKVDGTAFNLSLNEKWSLVSVPIQLQSGALDDVFADHQDDVVSVWAYEDGVWTTYTPDGVSNDDLNTMKPGWGYWVLTTDQTDVTIGGSLFSPATTPPSKPIHQGWNLIGYYGTEGLTYQEEIQSIPPSPYAAGEVARCELNTLYPSLWDTVVTSLYTYWEPNNPEPWIPMDVYGSNGEEMTTGMGYWAFYSGNQEGIGYAPSTNNCANILNVALPELGGGIAG